jgi:hypothetical protein
MFIDAIGEEVLLFVKRLGAQFVAETSYSRDVCERLQLPFIGKRKNEHARVGWFNSETARGTSSSPLMN